MRVSRPSSCARVRRLLKNAGDGEVVSSSFRRSRSVATDSTRTGVTWDQQPACQLPAASTGATSGVSPPVATSRGPGGALRGSGGRQAPAPAIELRRPDRLSWRPRPLPRKPPRVPALRDQRGGQERPDSGVRAKEKEFGESRITPIDVRTAPSFHLFLRDLQITPAGESEVTFQVPPVPGLRTLDARAAAGDRGIF